MENTDKMTKNGITPDEELLAANMRYTIVSMGQDVKPRLMKRNKLIWYCIHDGASKWACTKINHDVIDPAVNYYATLTDALVSEKTKPVNPDGYADHLSGNWEDVPEWAIERINFLEESARFNERSRCPNMDNDCPDCPEMSCSAVKHCYPYLCKGSCGHNEIWVSDEDIKMLKEKYSRM